MSDVLRVLTANPEPRRPPVRRPGRRDSAARLAHGRRHQGAGAGDRHDELRAVQVERQLAAGPDGADRRTPGGGGGGSQGGHRELEDGSGRGSEYFEMSLQYSVWLSLQILQ